MTETMIERVARALCERHVRAGMTKDWTASLAVTPLEDRVRDAVGRSWPNHVDDARAAVATMREPTLSMENEGWRNYNKGPCVVPIYQAMIDDALADR